MEKEKKDMAEVSNVDTGMLLYITTEGNLALRLLNEPKMVEILGLLKYAELEIERIYNTLSK